MSISLLLKLTSLMIASSTVTPHIESSSKVSWEDPDTMPSVHCSEVELVYHVGGEYNWTSSQHCADEKPSRERAMSRHGQDPLTAESPTEVR
ncbi:hypothetical protein [Parasphingorhabdus sp.]|uniref:hypothetical protein n=1 Tax=Parasphingorhabdus sp. TaxID=2709688 RepID=UPI003002BE2F